MKKSEEKRKLVEELTELYQQLNVEQLYQLPDHRNSKTWLSEAAAILKNLDETDFQGFLNHRQHLYPSIPLNTRKHAAEQMDGFVRQKVAEYKRYDFSYMDKLEGGFGQEEGWDVFVSHASEDKESFVRPLAEALAELGVKIWFDQFTLKIGDSLSRSIDKGLAKSKFGIVVLSRAFMGKGWPEYELRGLTSQEIGKGKVILPIWHGVSKEDVSKFSPSLADKIALDTSKLSPQETALQILEVVRPDIYRNLLRLLIWRQYIQSSEVKRVKLSSLKMGPIHHTSLSSTLLVRIKNIQRILKDVLSISLKETIENFQRDANPGEEVVIWERIVATYLDATQEKDLPIEKRREIFSILLGLSMEPLHEDTIKRLKYTDQDEVERLKNLFSSAVPYIADSENG